MTEETLEGLVASIETAPAWQRKQEIGLLANGLVPHAPIVGGKPVRLGDDAAAIETENGYLLLASEVIYPPLVEDNPYLAGRYAILANVNDIYAMGGYPMAIVDTILSTNVEGAVEIVRGLQDGCNRYGVPLVGGHLTATGDTNSLSACILGQAKRLLSSFNAQAGDTILHVINLRGHFHPRFSFWDCSAHLSDAELCRDLAILPTIAEEGWCDAARDISMSGLFGSLLMLLELSGVGAVVQLGAIPKPPTAAERYLDWLLGFPSFGFILAVRPKYVSEIQDIFKEREITCAVIGEATTSQHVVLTQNHQEALLMDLAKETFTGFSSLSN